MERKEKPWRLALALAAGALGAFALRRVISALAVHLGAAALLMAAALPLCRLLERRVKPSAAAFLSLLLLLLAAGLTLVLFMPPMLRQVRQLTASVPVLLGRAEALWQTCAAWLQARGIDVAPVQEELFALLSSRAGTIIAALADTLSRLVSTLSRLLLTPLLAFYLLRDRGRIAARLTLLLPIVWRARGVRAAREARRETAAFLRGQLLLSLSVGAMTALALLLAGTPGWLMLGALMGVMELIPYIGPVLAGVPAVLLALTSPGGWLRALWTLISLVAVQQVEGAVLSPRLLGSATQLHPMAVLLLIPAGGILLGPLGMIAILPAVTALRGALRGWRT
ncbi:MAG: AI-2E family transporter [Clostridia bacterium]|nr:AI-2E family transporter [Clostridia bacterium]